MKYLLIGLVVLMIAGAYADCEDGQIDINDASLSELDELSYIGPVKAQAIIDTRPFDSVDDLIDVYGIGPVTLQNIKDQGLACVEDEGEQEEVEEDVEEELEDDETEGVESQGDTASLKLPAQEPAEAGDSGEPSGEPPEVIKLQAQTIKGEDDSENPIKVNYPMYGFVLFCVLLGFLFVIKRNRFNKNEFR